MHFSKTKLQSFSSVCDKCSPSQSGGGGGGGADGPRMQKFN